MRFLNINHAVPLTQGYAASSHEEYLCRPKESVGETFSEEFELNESSI